MNITKILILDHISNNTSSINSYLEYVDSIYLWNRLNLKCRYVKDIIKYYTNTKKLYQN